jgi:hypothetical protein
MYSTNSFVAVLEVAHTSVRRMPSAAREHGAIDPSSKQHYLYGKNCPIIIHSRGDVAREENLDEDYERGCCLRDC